MAIVDYETRPDDVVVSPSGWAKVGDAWQTVEPLRDRRTGLYARTSYAGGLAALRRLGLRMPTGAEVDARLAATRAQRGLILPVLNLPDAAIQAANGVYRSSYQDPNDYQAAVQSLLDRYMKTPEWAQYHDDLVQNELERLRWDGRTLLSNIGKMWIAGASAGRALLKGWWNGTSWIQSGTAAPGREKHNDAHHDYGTLLYGVSDTDPSLRPDLGGDTGLVTSNDYVTEPDDVVVSPSGWARVGNAWQTVEPLRDRSTGLYARTSYAGGRTALRRLGLRMPTRAEVIARRAETLRTGGIELPVFNFPSDASMRTLPVAQRHDEAVAAELARRKWDGRSLISNLGKMWIGAGPGDPPIGDHDPTTGVPGGRARLMGWWSPAKGDWIQQGYGISASKRDVLTGAPAIDENHDENHHDYGTLLYGVSDSDPESRIDANQSTVNFARTPSPQGAASVAVGAGRVSRDTRGPTGLRGLRGTTEGLFVPIVATLHGLNFARLADRAAAPRTGGGPSGGEEAGDVVGPVLLFGDSLAQGLTRPLAALAKSAGVTFRGDGVQSSTIRDWLAGGGGIDASGPGVIGPGFDGPGELGPGGDSFWTDWTDAGAAAQPKKLRPKLAADLASVRPALTLVSLGTNDMAGVDAAGAGRRAADLIAFLKANGAGDIVWIAPPSMPFNATSMSAFREALKAACDAAGVPVFSSEALPLDRAKDGIHCTEKGYRDWAAAIATSIGLPMQSAARANDRSSPAPASAYKPATNITKPMFDWINQILHDPTNYPLGSKADRAFGSRVMQARVETHPPDKNIPRDHRGVGLWEAPPGTAVPPSAPEGPPAPTAPPVPPAPSGSPAPALIALKNQIDAMYPRRSRSYDGISSSAAHRAKNPNSQHDYGNAIDITTDRANGPNLDMLAEALLRDPRTWYVIWRGRIANTKIANGAWRPYTRIAGDEDPHESHLHMSIDDAQRDDAGPWNLSSMPGPRPWTFAPFAASAPDPNDLGPSVYVQPYQAMKGKVPVGPPIPIGPMPMPIETYLAHVVTAELGGAGNDPEAARAQAIAARTFLRFMMNANPKLGTKANPIKNSESFQVAAPVAKPWAVKALADTRGIVMLWNGKPIVAYYVSGAHWPEGEDVRSGAGGREDDPQHPMEPLVTYNEGLSGAGVHPRPGVAKIPQNRGAMSQNGAIALARKGVPWPAILHFFYGADIQFTPGPKVDEAPDAPSDDRSVSDTTPTNDSDAKESGVGLGTLAAAAALVFGLLKS